MNKEIKEIIKSLWLGRVSDVEFQKQVELKLVEYRRYLILHTLNQLGEAAEVEVSEPEGVETEYGKGFSAGVQEGWNAARKKIITIFNITAG